MPYDDHVRIGIQIGAGPKGRDGIPTIAVAVRLLTMAEIRLYLDAKRRGGTTIRAFHDRCLKTTSPPSMANSAYHPTLAI
jgi:hypothetical protein